MRNHKKISVQPNTQQRLITLAVASACAAFVPAFAQTIDAAADAPQGETQKVVVTGIRAAMQSTLNLKRNADGFVDGIVADDIGKFPDTNLAESLQRISGVSIDRNMGEGSRVTVRGVGPDLNLVLLNGRQMPSSSIDNLNGRSFDFANLASESISQLQVYKSARADTPPGGIGATINVMTARPFDRPGLQASVGVKGLYDKSNSRLPSENSLGKSLTPEVSGIFSNTYGMFGVAVSGSYQERNLGVNSALIPNGWKGPYTTTGPQTVENLSEIHPGDITNPPKAGDIYLRPQNLNYNTRGTNRERINGQIALQFKPNADLLTTVDYTYSQNKLHSKYNELSVWFNDGPSIGAWTNGPIASPLQYGIDSDAQRNQDLSVNGGDYAVKSTNNSLGFNQQWKVSPSLKLNFDAHHSTAVSEKDSPWGTNNDVATAAFGRDVTIADFTHYMPVLTVRGDTLTTAPFKPTGTNFADGYQKMTVDQFQVSGRQSLFEASTLNFGLASVKTKNHSLFKNIQGPAWGGLAGDFDQSMWHPARLGDYFGQLEGSNAPEQTQLYSTFNFEKVRAAAIAASGRPQDYTPSLENPDYDRYTTEKSKSLYVQFNTEWEIAGMPTHTGIGVRYEKTDVISTTRSATPTTVDWLTQNEMRINTAGTTFVEGTGSYSNVLPTIDFDIEPRSDLKLRASAGVTIGRPMYDQIIASRTLSSGMNLNGATGNGGNPGLKPVKSKNLDVSAEWYYTKQSMASLGLFYKKLSNFVGETVVNGTETGLLTPIGGAYYRSALAATGGNCAESNTTCIRNYIFNTYRGQPGVVQTSAGPNAFGLIEGIISGVPGDPALTSRVTTPVNARNDTLKGLEVNVQHMFGTSGFGVQANFTKVKSGLQFDNAGNTGSTQFALVGLSDSANLVGIYEDAQWSIRAAYNWRDKFLTNTTDNSRPNPVYTDAYGQLDLSVGYNINKNLSVSFEGMNLTDETVRRYGRTESQVMYAAQSGPRYSLAARYKF